MKDRFNLRIWEKGVPKYKEENLMTEEEIHDFAVKVVAGQLQNSGYKIHAFNPILGSYPSIVAENDDEVVAVIVIGGVSPIIPKLKLTDKFGIIGYCNGYETKPCFASVSIGSVDPERFDTSLALSGDEYLVHYKGIEYIDKEIPKIGTEEYKIFVMQFIGGYLRAQNYDAVEKYISKNCVIENSITKETIDKNTIKYLKKIFEQSAVTSHCIIKSVGNWKTINVENLYIKDYVDGKPGTVKILQEADKIGLLLVTEMPAFDENNNGMIFNIGFNKRGKINKINIIDPRYYEFEAYDEYIEETIEKLNPKDNFDNYENSVNLKGYITKKPQLRTLESGVKCATFTLGVKRKYKNIKGTYDFDFINIICWRELAEKVYEFDKDDFVELEGHVQTRTYTTEENERRFITEVYCIKIEKIKV